MSENEDSNDGEILDIYLVGNYVYSVYKKQTGGIDITGDPNEFYLVLGWAIKSHYIDGYNHIINNLIPV